MTGNTKAPPTQSSALASRRLTDVVVVPPRYHGAREKDGVCRAAEGQRRADEAGPLAASGPRCRAMKGGVGACM